MEKAGFKVDMQSIDWQTVVARRVKKDPANAGGWHAMLTSWVSADILNPVMAGFVNASCDKASFGWPCDAEMEKLRDDFARATDPAKQKEIAEAVQMREREVVTHIHLGQWYQPIGDAQEHQRHPDRAGAGVLERREEVAERATIASGRRRCGAGQQPATVRRRRRQGEVMAFRSLRLLSPSRSRLVALAGGADAKTLRVAPALGPQDRRSDLDHGADLA